MTLGPYFVNKNLFIRSFNYSEINTFGLPKFSKISCAVNILLLIPVHEMAIQKAIQKNHPKGRLRRKPSIKQRIWKNLVGVSAPLEPSGSAYDHN